MQISLSQKELIAAVHLFIEKQGISLKDKVTNVTFTTTRTGAGTISEIEIMDAQDNIPGYSDDTSEDQIGTAGAQVGTVTQINPNATAGLVAAVSRTEASAQAEANDANEALAQPVREEPETVDEAEVTEAAVTEAAPKNKASLFG